jgi:hypothetical protein
MRMNELLPDLSADIDLGGRPAGRRPIVTAAGAGIGRATAHPLAAECA